MPGVTIPCPSCKTAIDPTGFLSGCSAFHFDIDSLRFSCPECRETTDARVEHGLISVGYIYAAGAVHYCGMEEYAVEGLHVRRRGYDLLVELNAATWTILST